MVWLTLLPFTALLAVLLAEHDRQRLQATRLGTSALLAIGVPSILMLQRLLQPWLSDSAQWLLSIGLLSGAAWLCQKLLQRITATPDQDQTWLMLLGNGAALSCLLTIQHSDMGLAQANVISLGSAAGFYLALGVWATWQKRLTAVQPAYLIRGMPLLLISAGLLGLALSSFSGLGDL